MQRLKKKIHSGEYKDITIVGAGPLGLELSEALYNLGFNINVLDRAEKILPQYNSSITEILEKNIKDKIKLLTNTKIVSSIIVNNKIELKLNNNNKILTDLVIVTVGNIANTSFLRK